MSTLETKSGTEDPDDAENTTLDRDDVFHILQVQRRRWVLKYLEEYEGDDPAAMSDIAEHIAARENDTTVDALRSQQRQRVYIALYQSHLPKMDKMGVIEYNQYRGKVERTELTEKFERYLFDEPSLLSDDDDELEPEASEAVADAPAPDDSDAQASEGETTDWSSRYLYATGGALLGLGSAFVGLLPQLWVMTFVTGTFGVLGAGHAFERRRTLFANA